MVRIKWLMIPILLLAIISCEKGIDKIIACGDDQVLIIDAKTSIKDNVNIIWKWSVSDATDLPKAYQKYMIPTDECKPVDSNRKILITSSGGGVVLVDRETKKSLFYAHVPNAHSAEYLPKNRIVVALSTDSAGNSLELYELNKPDKIIFKDSLFSGHGVIWLDKIDALFALGYNELRKYSLKNWDSEKPELELMKTWILPDNGGHDLNSISESKLLLTTTNGVWVFDIPKEEFSPFDLLNQVKNVKSVNYIESTGELVYTKGEISWWTHNIYFKNPDKTITIPDINLYKVRVISK